MNKNKEISNKLREKKVNYERTLVYKKYFSTDTFFISLTHLTYIISNIRTDHLWKRSYDFSVFVSVVSVLLSGVDSTDEPG